MTWFLLQREISTAATIHLLSHQFRTVLPMAALRFGHSTIGNTYKRGGSECARIPVADLHNLTLLYEEYGIDGILKEILQQSARKIDRWMLPLINLRYLRWSKNGTRYETEYTKSRLLWSRVTGIKKGIFLSHRKIKINAIITVGAMAAAIRVLL